MGSDRNQGVVARTICQARQQQHAVKLLLAIAPALVLGACADSARFSSNPFRTSTSYGGPRVISAPVDDIEPLPGSGRSPEVISSPLPPAGGMSSTMDRPLTGTMSPSMGGAPGQDTNAAFAGGTPPGPVASLTPPSTPATPSPSAAPSRTAVTGSWKASEAAGGSCRVVLSSSPSLDLYKASSSGCASQDLKSVNAWDLRGNEVYLYARGNVVARLRGGSGSFSGVLAKSGAPVTLSR